MIVEIRHGRVTLAQPCKCGSMVGLFVYEFRGGLLWSDVWACVTCGRTLYEWTWDSTMIACQEIKAELVAEQQLRNDIRSVVIDARKGVAPKKKQLGLF